MINRRKMLQGMAAAAVAASLLVAASYSETAEHGMDEKVLSQIPKKLQVLVDRGQISGVATLVARKGKIASTDAVGWHYMAKKELLETADVFWVASMTKPFVPVAIMMLVDDLVEDYIPEFKGQKVKTANGLQSPKHPLTIRNLLNHLDGLSAVSGSYIKKRALASAKSRLMWEPGSKFKYTGRGLYVAAYIVEKVSGMPYVKFLKTRILDPLGMKNTYFTIKNVPKSRFVPMYRKLENGKWEFKVRTKDRAKHSFAVDAGFYTTAEDMFIWCQMLLNGGEFGGVRYLSEKSVYELTHKQTGDVKYATYDPGNFFALGFMEAVEPQGITAALTKGSFGKSGAGGSVT